ncbi:TPA: hypothetical protein ACP33B_004689 [Pseudomonas aeruginosa]
MSGKLEAVLLHVIGLLKTDVEDYCDLETIDGGRAIVAQDGSLASIVRFNGTKSVLGREQFERLIQLLDGSFSVYFKNRGHQLQVVFRRDLDARGALERNAIQQRSTADRLSLGIHDLIDESVEKYSQYVYDEDCYLVFWSRPALLDTVEAKLATQATNEFRKEKATGPRHRTHRTCCARSPTCATATSPSSRRSPMTCHRPSSAARSMCSTWMKPCAPCAAACIPT